MSVDTQALDKTKAKVLYLLKTQKTVTIDPDVDTETAIQEVYASMIAEHIHANFVLKSDVESAIQEAREETEDRLLYDLDEIDNKPWRVFRQLAKIMPEYADEYSRLAQFYSYGGGRELEKLMEELEKREGLTNSEPTTEES